VRVISCFGLSGHSSFAFALFGFLFLYTAGKLKAFSVDRHGRMDSWRPVVAILIMLSELNLQIW
jgi:membrane-associated phospholipid phosphatase